MSNALDRAWWDEDGRSPDWPESLKDEFHAALLDGFNGGMTAAGHPEWCRQTSPEADRAALAGEPGGAWDSLSPTRPDLVSKPPKC